MENNKVKNPEICSRQKKMSRKPEKNKEKPTLKSILEIAKAIMDIVLILAKMLL